MIVVVYGGRDFKFPLVVIGKLEKLHAKYKFTKVIVGGAPGVDTFAEEWAESNDVPFERVNADWSDMSEPCVRKVSKYGEYNALAGGKRNQKMIDKYKPTLAIEFPGGPGTADMRKRVHEAMNKGRINKLITIKRKR